MSICSRRLRVTMRSSIYMILPYRNQTLQSPIQSLLVNHVFICRVPYKNPSLCNRYPKFENARMPLFPMMNPPIKPALFFGLLLAFVSLCRLSQSTNADNPQIDM